MGRWLLSLFLSLVLFIWSAPAALQEQIGGEEHTASVNGIQMHYRLYGQGGPLVLLHGFSGAGTIWEPLLPHLAAHYRLIVPDLRGHGRSSNPAGDFTHRQAARDVFALLDQLGIGRFSGIGTSTGGMTLIHMATQQVDRLESMVLVGATHYFPEEAREIMRRATVESLTEEDWKRLRQRHKLGDDQIRNLREQFHRFKDSYDDMNFTPPYLSTIRARTLIVHGDRDRFFSVEIPVEQYRSIPHSYLWIIPNAGHIPAIFGEHRQEFQRIALDFLTGKWERPGN